MAMNLGADGKTGFFAVFDGHGGKEVAKYVAIYMAQELVRTEGWSGGDLQSALTQVYLRMDEMLLKEEVRLELEVLAGDHDGPPGGGRAPVMVDASELPQDLRVQLAALDQARSRASSARRSARPGINSGGSSGAGSPGGEGAPEATELAQLDSALTADVAAAVAKAAAESGHVSLENSEAGSGAPSPPQEDDSPQPGDGRSSKRKRDLPASSNGVDSEEDGGDGQQSSSGDDSSTSDDGPDQKSQFQNNVPPVDTRWTGPLAGCTAVAALVAGGELIVANAGDSRCVACRNGTAVAMTEDHKPNDEAEHARILKAGGFVADGRVNGSLNLSRALGDMEYKQSTDLAAEDQIVTAVPEVRRMALQDGDEFLLLACDGIWDVLTNQEGVDFVRERLQRGLSPVEVCEQLCDHCLAPNTNGCGKGCDNMSAMVVLLKATAPELAAAQKGGSSS